MSIVEEERPTPTKDRAKHIAELVAGCPEHPTNGKHGVNQRMLENVRDPEYHDPITAALKKAKTRGAAK